MSVKPLDIFEIKCVTTLSARADPIRLVTLHFCHSCCFFFFFFFSFFFFFFNFPSRGADHEVGVVRTEVVAKE